MCPGPGILIGFPIGGLAPEGGVLDMSRGVLVAPSFVGGTEGVLLTGDTRGDWTRVTSGGCTLGCSERVASVFEGTVTSMAKHIITRVMMH